MMGIAEAFGRYVQSVLDNAPPMEGDYLDEEGLLICGQCHTRRQAIIDFPSSPGGKMLVPVMCNCRKAAEQAEAEEKQRLKDMEALQKLKKQSLMDSRLEEASFESFRVVKHNERQFRICKRYADAFDEMLSRNQGLLLFGGVGTGKTFAAACIANQLLGKRIPVVMTSFIRLLDSMQSFKEEDSLLINRLNKAKLLIIDDLGAERGTDFALEKVYSIIDSRYRAKLPIILTTNMSYDDMKKNADIRYARIYDRIFGSCYPLQFSGISWRKGEAVRRYEEMTSFLEGRA